MITELEIRKADRDRREAAQKAIQEARFYLDNAEVAMTGQEARRTIRGLLEVFQVDDDTRTILRAIERGQRTFTLVEQDKCAPDTIGYWILVAQQMGVHREKLDKVRQLEDAFRSSGVTKKLPD